MTAAFTLTVDTAAPHLTWGGVGGAYAGSLLKLGYTVNEPGILVATALLPDGRELPVTVTPSWLEVLLPPDTPDGATRVTAELADDVGNTATAYFDAYVSGTAPSVEPRRPGPGAPATTQRRGRTRLVRSPADPVRITVGPDTILRASPVRDDEIAVRFGFAAGHVTVRASPATTLRLEELAVKVRSGPVRIAGHRREHWKCRVQLGETAVLRRDGPDIEEALLFGLL